MADSKYDLSLSEAETFSTEVAAVIALGHPLKDGDGVSVLLISRSELRRAVSEVHTVRLAHDIYLRIGDPDAR